MPGRSLPPEIDIPPDTQAPRPPTPNRQTPSVVARKRAARGAVTDRGGDKRVRRGRLEIAARLDLHGHTQDQARAALAAFVTRWRGEGASVVLVVTGKGGRAGDGEGVLKRRVPEWLGGELRPAVSGYAQAHRRHGGDGAVYVFLRRPD